MFHTFTYTYSSKEHNPNQIFVTAYDLVFQHTHSTLVNGKQRHKKKTFKNNLNLQHSLKF